MFSFYPNKQLLIRFRIVNTNVADSRQLPINRKQKVFPNGTLIIENVERSSDQATYTCVARNAQGHTAKGNLEVQVMGMYTFCMLYMFVGLFFIFIHLKVNYTENYCFYFSLN